MSTREKKQHIVIKPTHSRFTQNLKFALTRKRLQLLLKNNMFIYNS